MKVTVNQLMAYSNRLSSIFYFQDASYMSVAVDDDEFIRYRDNKRQICFSSTSSLDPTRFRAGSRAGRTGQNGRSVVGGGLTISGTDQPGRRRRVAGSDNRHDAAIDSSARC